MLSMTKRNGVSELRDLHRRYMEELGLKGWSSAAFKSYVLFFSWKWTCSPPLPPHPPTLLTHHHSIHPLVRPDWISSGNSSSSISSPYGPGVVTASTSGTHTQAWSCPSVLFPLETTQASSSSPPLPSVVSEPLACARHCCKRFPCVSSFHPHDNYPEKAWLFFSKGILTPKSICFTSVGPLVWKKIVTSPKGCSGEALE